MIVYSPIEDRQRWVENELSDGNATIQLARSVAHVVAALVEDPAPRPQLLVIDIDALSAGELFHLHQIRERGWFGAVVALGSVPVSLRVSLGIVRAIGVPFIPDALRQELVKHRCAVECQTTQIPRVAIDSDGKTSGERLRIADAR